MPPEPDRIAFWPVGPAHYPLLRGWLEAPHMREWWGEPEEEFGFIRDMVEGRDTTRPFLIALDGEPVGYIQYWFVGHHQNAEWTGEHPWLLELPADTIGVDLSIGEADRLGMGIGSTALRAFVAGLVRDGHRSIVIDPDSGNVRAVRAYAKAGFRPVPRLAGRTGDALIMQYDPNGTEAT